jgi:hypothetical protein
MKTTKQSISFSENEIVCFHIGRGGRFYNSGHLTFEGVKSITQTSAYDKLFIDEDATDDTEFRDECGNGVDLTQGEANTGIGRINIDNDYDTTYTCMIKDLDESEINAIEASSGWEKEIIINTLIEIGLVEADEEDEEIDE